MKALICWFCLILSICASSGALAEERLLTWSAGKNPELDLGRKVEREVSWTFRMPLFKTNWGTLTRIEFIHWVGFGTRFHVKNTGNASANYTNTVNFVGGFPDMPDYWKSPFSFDSLSPFWFGYQWQTVVPRKSEDFLNMVYGAQDFNSVSSEHFDDFIGKGCLPVSFEGLIEYPKVTVPKVNDLSLFQPMAGITVYYYFEPVNPARIKYGPFQVYDGEGNALFVEEDSSGSGDE